MRVFCSFLFLFGLIACAPQLPVEPLPPLVRCKPTWENRSLNDWRKRECSTRDSNDCQPMGRATILVEFVHGGCRSFKAMIDNQAALIQGYAPNHLYVFVNASHDALTRTLFDHGAYKGAPCRILIFDDTAKADRKTPNEDQWFVELCKDATATTELECQSQLSDKRLYTP